MANWKDFLPKPPEGTKDALKERTEAWAKWFVPGNGIPDLIYWSVQRLAVPPLVLTISLLLLKWLPELRLMLGVLAIVPWLGYGGVCWLQWNVCRLWVILSLVLIGLGLLMSLPHVIAIWV